MTETNENTNPKPKRKLLWWILVIEFVCIAGLAALLLGDRSGSLRDAFALQQIADEAGGTAQAGARIPGLHPADVVALLEAEEFSCTDPRVDEKQRIIWKCEKSENKVEYKVLILSRSVDGVDLIDANINQSGKISNELAIQYLCFVGTLPFGGVEQAESCQWITQTLPKITKVGDLRAARFQEVPHLLYGVREARSLELGSLP